MCKILSRLGSLLLVNGDYDGVTEESMSGKSAPVACGWRNVDQCLR